MKRVTRFAPFALLTLAVLLFAAGCKSKTADNGQNAVQDSSADPASANLAPVSTDTSAQPAASSTAAPSDTTAPQSAAAPAPAADSGASAGSYDQASGGTVDDASYGEQPDYTAQQPPPELPDYQQPPAPGDGYEWTPGYWGYATAGYYWVPGVWVQAPYQGALWTPGYWGWTGGHYGFFHGYWGTHIGFYGGVNYGYGYVGTGYLGGYWHANNFFYNRTVNNINTTVIHNVYQYPVHVNNVVRVSYNGPGGIALRARPAELAAIREPHAPPMRAQIENAHAASVNRAQFVSENHGRPAAAVVERPLAADHDVHPVAAVHNEAMRPEARPAAQPARPNQLNRPAEARPAARPAPMARPEPHAAQRPAPGARPATPPAPASRPAPAARPAPHAAPARPESRPAPAAHPAPAHPAQRPAAKPEQPKRDDEHPR